MDAKLQGPVEGGRGGSMCRKSFKKIDHEGAERLNSSWKGMWGQWRVVLLRFKFRET